MLGHAEAGARPPERAENLPELHVLGRNPFTRHPLVATHQVGVGAKATDRQLAAAKPPGVRTNPAEIAHGIADMGDLPIEHGNDTVGRHHQVAVTKVVVHQGWLGLGRQMFEQPARRKVDHRLRRVQCLIALPGRAHGLLGAQPFQARGEAGRLQVDGVDAGQDLTALLGQFWSNCCQRGIAHDARAERLALEPVHDKAIPKAVLGLKNPKDFRLGDAGAARS